MIKLKGKHLRFLLISSFLLIGCAKYDKENIDATSLVDNEFLVQIDNDMEFLTSDQCSGRRPGTEGNKEAGDYIKTRFYEIGLLPLEEDYAIPYVKKTEILKSNNIKLELLKEGKQIDTLIYGIDYLEASLDDINMTLTLTESIENENCALLLSDASELGKMQENPDVKLILLKKDDNNRGGSFYYPGFKPLITILPDAFDRLQAHIGKNIRLTADIDIENIVQVNIIGKIKGENSQNALIVSAHFDHVGSVDNVIWRGAFDNASGVSTLIHTAQIVNNYYKDSLPPYDILFCAFNSEEAMSSGETGSYYFAQQIKDKYAAVFDINLDCLGNKDSTTLYVQCNNNINSKNIGTEITDFFNISNVNASLADNDKFMGDHKNFEQAVLITTLYDIESQNLHTTKDIPENINIEYLSSVGSHLGDFICNELDMSNIFDISSVSSKPKVETTVSQLKGDNLTKTEFETLYNCKLDFSDFEFNSISTSMNRNETFTSGVNNNSMNLNTEYKTLSLRDTRYYNFLTNFDMIRFITYDKSNADEWLSYDMDSVANGFGENSMSEPISIGSHSYYISNEKDIPNELKNPDIICSKKMSTIFENDSYVVRVIVSFPSVDTDSLKTTDDFKNYFSSNISDDFIDGMAQLLMNESN